MALWAVVLANKQPSLQTNNVHLHFQVRWEDVLRQLNWLHHRQHWLFSTSQCECCLYANLSINCNYFPTLACVSCYDLLFLILDLVYRTSPTTYHLPHITNKSHLPPYYFTTLFITLKGDVAVVTCTVLNAAASFGVQNTGKGMSEWQIKWGLLHQCIPDVIIYHYVFIDE